VSVVWTTESSLAEAALAAARACAEDALLARRVELLCRRIELAGAPEDLRGGHVPGLAARFGAPGHLVLVAVARLCGRDVLELAVDAARAASAPAEQSLAERRRERERALARLAHDDVRLTGDADLDALVASCGCFGLRAAARLVESRLGERDPAGLRGWESAPLVEMIGSAELVDEALRLLAAIRDRPHVRVAWDRWRGQLEPAGSTCASRPPGPPDRRGRRHGEREMGELRRRIQRAQEIPVPHPEALRWPVIRNRRAIPDRDGWFRFRDMLGDVSCSFKPSVRHLRLMLGAALVLREADHYPNPSGEGRRTVFASYNVLNLAATGRDCQGEEYAAIDRWIYDMLTSDLQAVDDHADSSKRRRALTGTPLEDAHIRLAGGEVMRFADWYELPREQRPARARGAGPTLMLTFTETFYAAVMRRAEHVLINKDTAWAARDELVLLLRMESHTGVRRDKDAWEVFTAPPFLRCAGLHGSDQRAAELLVEDDLHALEEAWTPIRSVAAGDSKKGYAWLRIDVDPRAQRGRRPDVKTRRTRTRSERRAAWPHELPDRRGRRRSFAAPGTPSRTAQRRAARAHVLAASVLGLGARRAKTASRRRHTARHRARVQRDLDAAAQLRDA
jgi:hypothetical protein